MESTESAVRAEAVSDAVDASLDVVRVSALDTDPMKAIVECDDERLRAELRRLHDRALTPPAGDDDTVLDLSAALTSTEANLNEVVRRLGLDPDADLLTQIDALAVRAREAEGLRQRVAELGADVEYAAGECLVPLPEPGSDLARVCLANRLLGSQRDAAEREAAELRARCERAEAARGVHSWDELYDAAHAVYIHGSEAADNLWGSSLLGTVAGVLGTLRAQARAAEPAGEATHG